MARLAFFTYAGMLVFVSLLPPGDVRVVGWDKLAHAMAYALFGLIGFAAFRGWRPFAVTCIGIIAFGVVMELAQGLVPGREPSVLDAVANTFGVALAALACVIWARRETAGID